MGGFPNALDATETVQPEPVGLDAWPHCHLSSASLADHARDSMKKTCSATCGIILMPEGPTAGSSGIGRGQGADTYRDSDLTVTGFAAWFGSHMIGFYARVMRLW